ncbi:MAG: SDR family NAD(P)-dependent oxidoreductase [Oligoflexia bacterium]|nr:SDR family NAD(P)-dependent oxidoreductase [Oligoflexia bacterium]
MNIFITGGTSGIGLALARLYYKNANTNNTNNINNINIINIIAVCGGPADEFLKKLSPGEEKYFNFYLADVTIKDEIQSALKDFSLKYGGIDLVILSAGVPIYDMTAIPDFNLAKKMVDVHLIGMFNTFETAIEIMTTKDENSRGQGGSLAVISSIASFNGIPGIAAYSATKAAINVFCEALAIDLHQHKISVTVVCPGFVKTPFTEPNTYPMPFLISAEVAAQIIKRAIDRKLILKAFPFILYLYMFLLKIIPRSLYVYLMRKG